MQCISIFTSTISLLLLSMAYETVNADIVRIDVEGQMVNIDVEPTDETEQGPRHNSDSADGLVGLIDPVLRLNRFTFQNTILDEHEDEIPDWVVLFCPQWFKPCQQVEVVYRQLADKWQNQLNDALLTTQVRFAAVDCATEKALCNTQNVDTYPFVAHYHHRKQVQVWRGRDRETSQANVKRFHDFLQKALSPAAPTRAAAVEAQGALFTAVEARRIAALLIFAAIAGNMWFMICSGGASPKMHKKPVETQSSAFTSRSRAASQASCTLRAQASCTSVRALPREWALERPSLEL